MPNGSGGMDCHLCFHFKRVDEVGLTGECQRHKKEIEEAYHSVCRDWFRDDVGSPHVWEILNRLKANTLYSIADWSDLHEIADLS